MGRIGSFHLVSDRSVGTNLAHLGGDRRHLARTEGLRFWRLLGTGRGSDTGPGADLRRRAMFAVWEEEADLDRFLAMSPVAATWTAASEVFTVRLRGLAGHGHWKGVDPLEAMEPGHDGGPVAALTRAHVRLRHWRTFARAGAPVSAEVGRAEGLLAVCGIGEAPLGSQATFSLWRSPGDLRAFAYGMAAHAEVVRRTRSERWYGEELFARFEPFASQGSWDGADPLSV